MVLITARASTFRPHDEDVRAAFGELGLTTAFMFAVFTLVRWGMGTAGAHASAADLRIRCVAVSMLVGLTIVGFAGSRPGQRTGAHMNPAITLALFVHGRTPARRVLPYLAAQTAGSVAAAVVARLAWGAAMSQAPTRWAVVQPASGRGGTAVAFAEAGVLAVIVVVMCWVSDHRPAWSLPWIVGLMFGLQGAALGTITGGSANPARQLGPALLSGQTHLLIVYLAAPIVGGVVAAWAIRCRRRRRPGAAADDEAHGDQAGHDAGDEVPAADQSAVRIVRVDPLFHGLASLRVEPAALAPLTSRSSVPPETAAGRRKANV